ncbi:amino acid adenylation domain-containing protein [Dactylosporangium sp. NPDC051485]|uniref:amino acid adenylation domain-containing protein n=1 Tax=Dactylosporangium sp. NPDC051485 TaxID=3154846 RepID=UPI00343A6126
MTDAAMTNRPSAARWTAVRNEHGRRSVWPADTAPPAGWHRLGTAGDRSAALDLAGQPDPVLRPGPAPSIAAWPGQRSASVAELFAAAVDAAPDRVAVQAAAAPLTYRALADAVARARTGLHRLGVRRGSTVAVSIERGPDLIVVLLALLGAGAAYVPVDPRHPPLRLEYMIRDARAELVVSTPRHVAVVAAAGTAVTTPQQLQEHPPHRHGPVAAADDIAYVMYTSGSTGHPKGVEVAHRSLLAFLEAMTGLLPATAASRVLFSTRLSFDIATLEYLLPLTSAGTCVVAPETGVLGARRVARQINEAAPSLVQATPVGLQLLLDAGARFTAAQTVLCGGDVLSRPLADRLAALPATVFNVYGPTEATIWATAWPVRPGAPRIGGPLGHAGVYLLDGDLRPVPPGEEGEIYIGGPAVAHGYRGRGRLTAERFVPDPFAGAAGATMYATGDIARLIDGELEYRRRTDTQVKINGHRVELGEIETVASTVAGVRTAVAVVHQSGGTPVLHLFVESRADPALLASAVQARLRDRLPSAMVPGRIEAIAALPLTENGKIDRGALAARGLAGPAPVPAPARRHREDSMS